MIQHHEIVRCNILRSMFINKPIDHLNDTRCDKKQTMKRHKIKIEFILNNKFDNHWRPSYQLLKLMDRRLHKNKHLTGKFLLI